jgi:outer membrane protein assembly factor BamA
MFGDLVGITGWAEWRKYPYKFYGVGNSPDFEVADDYTERVFEATPQVTLRIYRALRAGLNAHVLAGTFEDYPADGLLVGSGARGLGSLTQIGLGPTLSWDTRDSNFWPKGGSLVNLDLTIFNRAFGADYDFTRFTADMRTYFNPWRDHALAVQGYLRLSDGAVPFFFYPSLGGTRIHRGWYNGSLRDQHALAVQAEYRAPIWWRFGLVAFAGLGQVVPDLGKLDLGALRGSVGGGVRFRLNDDGVNIRLDFAYGGQFEFYFQVGEAF